MATYPVFLPGESHGQRRLAGYSPQDHKESGLSMGGDTGIRIRKPSFKDHFYFTFTSYILHGGLIRKQGGPGTGLEDGLPAKLDTPQPSEPCLFLLAESLLCDSRVAPGKQPFPSQSGKSCHTQTWHTTVREYLWARGWVGSLWGRTSRDRKHSTKGLSWNKIRQGCCFL